jgi:hypothetical protein
MKSEDWQTIRVNNIFEKESIAIKRRGGLVNPLSLDHKDGLVSWFGNQNSGGIIGITLNRGLLLHVPPL